MSRTPAAVLLGLLVLLAGPLQAQQTSATAPASGGGDEPIEINSDRLVLEQNQQVATFTGNVDAVQGVTRLQSDKMRVFYANNPGSRPTAPSRPAATSRASTGSRPRATLSSPSPARQRRAGRVPTISSRASWCCWATWC